jgi:hypothetical protein
MKAMALSQFGGTVFMWKRDTIPQSSGGTSR